VADPDPPDDDAVPRVAATETTDATGPRKKLRAHAADAVGDGVSAIGGAASAVGAGVNKVADLSRKIPLVGAPVGAIGGAAARGVTAVGDALQELPRVAKTRAGALLVRSMFAGFLLVAAWIAAIVALQLRDNDTPDLRPDAEHILVELSKGGPAIDQVFEQSSPRFQEMVRKERFVDDMTDLNLTVGKFREITAVNDTNVSFGPTGEVARVALTAAYDHGTCKVSVSLHRDAGRWKLLGVNVELPPDLRITQMQREARVAACADPMDLRKCDVHQTADAILKQLRDGHADQVWDAATPVFQKQEDKSRFVEIQNEHVATLGAYRRIIAVTEAKAIGGTSATFDALAEFDKASGARTVFAFSRTGKTAPWLLRSFKIVLPMPRQTETPAAGSAAR
jgi:hypothetical protein